MKLFITSQLPKSIEEQLKDHDLNYHNSNQPLTKNEILEGVKDAEVLVCPLSDKIDEEILEAGKHLKLVANYGAGFDNIDLDAAKARDIVVTNAPAPSSAVSTAELTFGLILSVARKLMSGERDLRAGKFAGWRPTYFLGNELRGKTLGIIGMGNIGSNLAKRALAFEMNVIYYSRTRKDDIESLGVVYKDRDSVIREADFLSLHTAFVPELKHMMNLDTFNMMKEDAFFINAARGPLMKEEDLVTALKEGMIQGAGLDVYEFEPKVTEALLDLDNVVLLPHLGNATFEARLEMGQAVVDNIKDLTEGKTPRNKVN